MTQDQEFHTSHDILDPARIAALAATLSLPDATPRPFWHQIYFWDAQSPKSLGRDGHPATGGLIPDLGLPRRMWAGGRLRFHATPTLGTQATKTTTLLRADRKTGRTGPLGLVTLRHEVSQDGQLLVSEEQDLIYRAADAPKGTPPPAPDDQTTRKTHIFTPTELFRYSALTFNGHRIHYDRDYATGVEGYGGLVVHGPLLAQYVMLMAEDLLGAVRRFDFRATAPLMDGEEATFCARPEGDGLTLWARAADGRQCLTATAA
ncbi:3-methylfumaryl-CoA hydratase [Litoreibacter ponti]|uniref:3-methylfumaryl-CoA hydratase n=1 Tax=Litoreibacter ponti TaxID=1510457 RepID=A0A2T6BN67_9RHOB|nr:acyl dehydratase [Litoreibacter ponti]PTX57528.1 3-methylfumaryl-CoA hydratase [Litoreibacter ponti]